MLADWPCHITHRGNHRRTIFETDAHRELYLRLLQEKAVRFGMRLWAYCLMGNHVHLIATGDTRLSISKALGSAHAGYSRCRNREWNVTGHLWANRFFSTLLDETHLWAAVRYVELNPVRGGLVGRATHYRWSSARIHAGLAADARLDPGRPFPGPIADWASWLGAGLEPEMVRLLRENTASGLPSAGERALAEIERELGRRVRLLKPGPKPGGNRTEGRPVRGAARPEAAPVR